MALGNWFDILATIFYVFSFIVAGLISALGFKAYKITKEKKFRNLSIAFLFITLSFVVQALTNLIVYFNLQEGEFILSAINSGFVIYALLTIVGFFLLAILTLKLKDAKIIILAAAAIPAALFFSPNFIIAFHAILLALLILIIFKSYQNCCAKKSLSPKIVLAAFLLMAIAHIFHIAGSSAEPLFITGSIVQFAGYFALLIAILRVK